MILAAGEGTRLRPLTLGMPKALLPIAGVPLIEYQFHWLKKHGIVQVAVNLHYIGDKIRSHLGDGSKFGMEITYSPEETLLGTAGGVKKMEQFWDGTFTVVYGDVLTNLNLSKMAKFHRGRGGIATLAVFEGGDLGGVGIVRMDKKGRVLDFVEKPPCGSRSSGLANGGVYVLERDVLEYISEGFSDFGYDVFPRMIGLGLPIYGYSLKDNEYLVDIGTPASYERANMGIGQ